ncbi:HAD family hydrolase [Desulfocurvus vexinensis]|uniref:HAD family hydrolase n=1 Tax=Desulfocurvus vexinensis TaxID=399548 RepID=UPI0004B6B542|nr:HAD family hydrolase [Desulfocurvus vexinensis]
MTATARGSALDVIVFDFDGVILNSMPLKTTTFGRLFEDLGPEASAYVRAYHVEHAGVSRYVKFEHFYQKFHGRSVTPEESAALDRRFAELAMQELLRTPTLPGAREFLEAHHATWPLYVASGAPQYELDAVLGAMGLARCFKAICGAPPAKAEVLRRIVQAEGADPARVLMIGDANTDLAAARAVGTRFLGVGPFPEPVVWMADLTGLPGYIASLG